MFSRERHKLKDKRNFIGRPLKRKRICYANRFKKKSASARKLSSMDYPEVNFVGYRLFDLQILFDFLQSVLHCQCGGSVKFFEQKLVGLAGFYVVVCDKCQKEQTFSSSKKIGAKANILEVNRRSVLATRLFGGGLASLNCFCCIMDLPHPVRKSTYRKIKLKIWQETLDLAKDIMRDAVEEEVILTKQNPSIYNISEILEDSESESVKSGSEPNPSSSDDSQLLPTCSREIGVSGDGTWQRRGHQSLNGVCTVLGLETGKVIDIEILSSYCLECTKWEKANGKEATNAWKEWYSKHLPTCSRNHFGSAGSMEPTGMLEIFQRSVEDYNVMYTTYLGDGDSSTFLTIKNAKPYGKNVKICKKECCGHVQKRFGTQLRKLRKEKKLGGKGKLTDKLIKEMQSYYGNAVRGNSNNIESMTRAIWAIFYHKASTDSNPQHHQCPQGAESWCRFQKAVTEGNEKNYKHPRAIPTPVLEEIRVVFERLSTPELLSKCIGGKTQNVNESYNNVIWNIVPKTEFVSLQTLEMAAHLACITFNTGYKGILHLMMKLDLMPGKHALEAAILIDQRRIQEAEAQLLMNTKEARRMRRKLNIPDSDYAAGAH